MIMKRIVWLVVLAGLAAMPVRAEDVRREAIDTRVTSVASAPRLDLGQDVLARALALSLQQQAPPPGKGRSVGGASNTTKAIYFATLAGAVAGMVYNIHTTRDALDHHLQARTFPLVWKTTRDPADKNKVTGIIAGGNGGLLALGGIFFARGKAPLGTFVNVLVAGATTAVGLHNRSIVNDCASTTCQ
jgi:hypothetical protein